MSKATDKEIKLEVALQLVGFPKTLYFNRLRVDKDTGFKLVQFGLVVASDLVDNYSCVLTDGALEQNRQTLLDYLQQLGPDVAGDVFWKGATGFRTSDIADIVSMAFRGDVAETIFSVFSMCAVSQVARAAAGGEASSIPSQPLVLLRSTKTLQKELITALYG